MMTTPLVSVCIPTFNGASFLQDALESVALQTYGKIEIIISDDSSTDNSLEIIQKFKEKVSIPIKIYNHIPEGIGANWNNCIKLASGKYIKFLFQDDILLPECIEKLLALAERDPEIGLVYCKRKFIYEDKNPRHLDWIKSYGNPHTTWKNIKVTSGIINGKRYLKDPKLFNFPENKIGEPTAVLINKKVFDRIGYFRTDLKQALDLDFWLRIMKHYKLGFVDEYLVQFRLHPHQASHINEQQGVNESKHIKHVLYTSLFWNIPLSLRIKLFKEKYKIK